MSNLCQWWPLSLQGICLQREGGWVPLLLWILVFEPPTPLHFYLNADIFVIYFGKRKRLFHQLCLYGIFERCLMPRKRWHDVPICVGKMGCAFFHLWSRCFSICQIAFQFYFRCVFVSSILRDSMCTWVLTRTNREEILAERGRFYDQSFGGLTVFIFREISCDSARWWNFISLS